MTIGTPNYPQTTVRTHGAHIRMEELLSCSVCCETYQEKMRHPVVLPRCGHSFCRPCVAFLVKNGCVICPSCRMDQRVETADNLPTEFSLLAITNAQQTKKLEICENHGVKLSFWCKTCGRPACGECLFEDHPTHSHTIVKSTTYISETKDNVTDIANKFIDALDFREKWFFQQMFQNVKSINDAIRTLSILRRDMEDARELIKGVKMVEGIGATTTLSDASKCLGLKWNLKNCQLLFNHSATGKKEETTAKEEKEKDEAEDKEKKKLKGEGEEEVKNDKEKCNGEVEKNGDEKEKEIDEEDLLTEEEKKKRRKIMRLKEKLAAAAANAEATENNEKDKKVIGRVKADLKQGEKEKIDDIKARIKTSNDKSTPTLSELKTKNLARKYVPVAREASASPEREKPTTSKTQKDNKDKVADTNTSIAKDTNSNSNKENELEVKMNGEVEDKKGEAQSNSTVTKTTMTTETQTENNEVKKSDDPKAPKEVDSTKEGQPKSKGASPPPSGPTTKKRGPGRLARQALKRSQTMNSMMNFSNQNQEDKGAQDTQESENIKGLDLETSNTGKSDEQAVDNKDIEAQANGEVKEEDTNENDTNIKVNTEKKETQEAAKEEKGAEGGFEMEPEEKERITTELMEVPSLTMVVEGVGGRQAFMAWEKAGLHVYCHQYADLPYDVLIKSTVLHSLIPTKAPMVFLDVGSEEKVLGRVYISLWGHLRRATNFLHLCLGDRGPSFRNTMFLEVLNADCPGERIKGGDYEFNNGRGGEGLIDDLEFQEGYSMPMESGMITAGGPNRREMDSQFFICTEDDHDRKFACPFGRVVDGLCVMKEAIWLVVTKEMWIRDCGVVLDVPKI